MPTIRQNRLIPILGVLLAVAVLGVVLRARHAAPKAPPMASVPKVKPAAPDGDTPSDTLRTLTAEMKAVKDENRMLRDDRARLIQQNDDLNRNRSAIEDNVTRRVNDQLSRPDANTLPVFSAMQRRLDDLAANVEKLASGASAATKGSAGGDLPAGLGYDPNNLPLTGAGTAGANAAREGTATTPASYVWIEPLGRQAGKAAGVAGAASAALPGDAPPPAAAGDAPPAAAPRAAPPAPTAPEPYFTVPENATLLEATAMTPLIGRTPVDGHVRDPFEFKVLVGAKNLAASGFEVPSDVAGMVVAGVAVGDWMLSCVEGHIQSITFIFEDRTIRTISKRGSGGSTTSSSAASSRLGYIADEHGAPCLNGLKVTNAPAYLSQVVGIKTLETAARAAALAQTSTTNNGLGSTSAVTGSQGSFVLGQAAAGGVGEVSQWLMRRLNDSFDAIYVGPGTPVSIHITEALALDKDPNGRKLDHGRPNLSQSSQRTARSFD